MHNSLGGKDSCDQAMSTWARVSARSVVSDSCDPMACSPPDSSVRGIFQARVLEWGAIWFSRGPSPPRNRTWVSCVSYTGRQVFTRAQARQTLPKPPRVVWAERPRGPPSPDGVQHVRAKCPPLKHLPRKTPSSSGHLSSTESEFCHRPFSLKMPPQAERKSELTLLDSLPGGLPLWLNW